tara:strand:- start:2376 stop:2747 length:372 start_codon:yes stop_codon:yes gene_type:complete
MTVIDNNTQLLMYYQTAFRNVALTTAVSFATLGYSRFYREKSKLYTSSLVFVSLLIVCCSILLNYYLYNMILEHYLDDENLNAANRFLIVNKIFFVIHMIIFILAAYTFLRVSSNKMFTSSKK